MHGTYWMLKRKILDQYKGFIVFWKQIIFGMFLAILRLCVGGHSLSSFLILHLSHFGTELLIHDCIHGVVHGVLILSTRGAVGRARLIP